MKKTILMLLAGIAFVGVMILNVQNSIDDYDFTGINLKVLSASADGDGCISADADCVQTWWKCVNGDCWTDSATFPNMAEY